MSRSDDDRGELERDPLARVDLRAWQPPEVPGGVADAVIRRMRDPVAVAAHEIAPRSRPRRALWWVGGALVAAAGIAGIVAIGLWSAPAEIREGGAVVAERASHLDLDRGLGATSAELDAGADLTWQRDGARVAVVQRRGAAIWRVGKADSIAIDAGAMGASVEASGASLRVEVHMQINGSDARVVGASAATAAVVALATVIVYQGHVRVTSGGQTVNVAAGSAVEVKPGEPARELRAVAATPTEPARTAGAGDAELEASRVDAALRGVASDIAMCLAGQRIHVTVSARINAAGTIESIEATPKGDAATCVVSAIASAYFPPSRSGGTFRREFDGDPDAPVPQNMAAPAFESNRIKGETSILPYEHDKLAIIAAGESRVIASLKVCVDPTGKVALVRMLKSSGYAGYDHKLQAEVRAWEYRPIRIDDKPASVCTAVTFIYQAK